MDNTTSAAERFVLVEQPAPAYGEWDAEQYLDSFRSDDEEPSRTLLGRIEALEAEVGHHNFALFNPNGRVSNLGDDRHQGNHPKGHRFFTSVALGCGVFILGCSIAANISVDAKQRGELSTVVACTSAVAGWAIVMMGVVKKP